MGQRNVGERNIVLQGIAGGLNALGSSLVFSYDACASGVGTIAGTLSLTPKAAKKLIPGSQCKKISKVSEQILRKIKSNDIKLGELYKQFGREQAAAEDGEAYMESEAGQSLRSDIRDLEENIERLKKRLVDIEENKKANILLKQELKVYNKRRNKLSQKHKKQYKDVISALEDAIKTQLEHGFFPKDSDFALLKNVLQDLLDPEMEIKILAVAKLGEMKEKAAIPILQAALGFDEPELTCEIIKTFSLINDPVVLPIISELLSDSYFRVRSSALTALCEIMPPVEAVEYFLKALSDGHPEVRMAAVKYLDWHDGQDVFEELAGCLKDENEGVRKAVVTALANMEDERTIPVFLQALSDMSKGVRAKALEGLRALTDVEIDFDLELKGKGLDRAIAVIRADLGGESAVAVVAEEAEAVVSEEAAAVVEEAGAVSEEAAAVVEEAETVAEEEETEAVYEENEGSVAEELQEVVGDSASRDGWKVKPSSDNLQHMVKPQLISLCREMDIEVPYTMSKSQIIAEILKKK